MLELCSAAKPEPGAHPEEILSRIRTFDGAPQSEEGVMLYSAFPQMLASFLVAEAEHEGVLLLGALVVILDHDQGQLLLFEVQFGNFGPKEKANFGFTFKHQNPSWCEAKAIKNIYVKRGI